MGDVAI